MLNSKRRNNWFLFIVGFGGVAGLYLAYVLLGSDTLYRAFGDDQSIYIVSAEALSAGKGYRLINFPAAPRATLYPIGYSALLVPFLLGADSFPHFVLAARLLSVFCSVLFVIASYQLLCFFVSPRTKLLIAAAIGIVPCVFTSVGSILSDPPFQALFIFAMTLLTKMDASAEPSQRKEWLNAPFAVGLCIGACLLLRSIAIVFPVAIGLQFLLRRQWKRLAYFAAGVLVLYGPWFAYNMTTSPGKGSFDTYLMWFKEDFYPRAPLDNLSGLLNSVAAQSVLPVSTTHLGITIIERLHLNGVLWVIEATLALLVLAGSVRIFKRHTALSTSFLLYMGLVLVCPWEPTRYAIPLLPLAAILAFEGLRFVLSYAVKTVSWTRASVLVLTFIVLQSVFVDLMWIRNVVVYKHFAGELPAKQWMDTSAACAWLKSNTPKQALVVSTYPYGVNLFTNRKTLTQPQTAQQLERLLETMEGNAEITAADRQRNAPIYVLATRREYAMGRRQGTEFGLALAEQYVQKHPNSFVEVWRNDDHTIRIYESQHGNRPFRAHFSNLDKQTER